MELFFYWIYPTKLLIYLCTTAFPTRNYKGRNSPSYRAFLDLFCYLAKQKTKIIFFKCEENLRIRSSEIYTPFTLGWSLSLQFTRSPTLSLLKVTTPCFLRLTSFFPTFPDKPIQMKPVRYTSNSTLKYFLDHNFLSLILFGLNSLYMKGNQFVGT